ncbi:hypothetical protein B0H13DRAFT_1932803 [Mycena leptocephala]|nr:hypothetical protein B0H13DRAFT_1932803 [Mycena leptocephala]
MSNRVRKGYGTKEGQRGADKMDGGERHLDRVVYGGQSMSQIHRRDLGSISRLATFPRVFRQPLGKPLPIMASRGRFGGPRAGRVVGMGDPVIVLVEAGPAESMAAGMEFVAIGTMAGAGALIVGAVGPAPYEFANTILHRKGEGALHLSSKAEGKQKVFSIRSPVKPNPPQVSCYYRSRGTEFRSHLYLELHCVQRGPRLRPTRTYTQFGKPILLQIDIPYVNIKLARMLWRQMAARG